MVKIIFAIVIIIIAFPLAFFMVKGCIDRSKSNKTSLFGSFNGEYREDPLWRSASMVEGLRDGTKRAKKE